ncbi:saccharopine dehydrogenase [Paenibacillus sp. LMG 31456]|uniref:Saccharopine dehydrogenase n=1 Tax=Paenibacillus foliorum TaxID=2654974 RepID=A0A972GZ79_9BACL|nr:saccharopine dehydrogenase NADP-binding domain-containing protein [Paenibacillus foliorum]NOU96873.1 saccharopine dehydrogenase [Paenibacillus foliorum]
MKEHIVVIGGYGHVGQMICRELCDLYPGKVFAAGRSLERAEQFSRATGGKVRPLQLNISEPVDPNALDNVKLIVMCLDQTDTSFVRSCLEKEIHHVDISANVSFLSQVEKLHSEALTSRSTAVLSIGLAPGMTNLMALHAKRLMDQTDAIDISIMLGLGDQHGKAAIEWTIDNLGTQYQVVKDGRSMEVGSFKDGKITDFGTSLGRKKAFRFNFSDQHVLPRTLGVPSVSTRLCFDSKPVTELLAWLRAAGVFRLLKYMPIRNTIVQLFGKMRFGTELFAVKIDAWGKKNQENVMVECFLQGKNEAVITAKVASALANIVYRSSSPHGVYHIDQLFDLETLLHPIRQMVSIETRINGKQKTKKKGTFPK